MTPFWPQEQLDFLIVTLLTVKIAIAWLSVNGEQDGNEQAREGPRKPAEARVGSARVSIDP